MFFGPLPPERAIGAWLAHSLKLGERRLGKGTRITADLAQSLAAAGLSMVTVARLDAGEIAEDAAAGQIAQALSAPGLRASAPFTGRANLYAERAGLLQIDADSVNRFNGVDEAITLATLPNWDHVIAGQMVATIKIIPFAVCQQSLTAAMALLANQPPLCLHPFQSLATALIQTELPATKPGVLDATAKVTWSRSVMLGARWLGEWRCPHRVERLAAQLCDLADAELILIAGASAVVDRQDVLPAAIEAAGGHVERFGLPVDPGNLLLIGRLSDRPVIGLPGCARSSKLNGFDWILRRILAGLPIDGAFCAGLGIGGLLKETGARPQPRGGASAQRAPHVAALVLAAGLSSRMGRSKLLLPLAGRPMIAHVVDTLIATPAIDDIIVVIGPDGHCLRDALAGRIVSFVENPTPEAGLSGSLRAGLRALPVDCDAVLIALGDMPFIDGDTVERLVAAFNPTEGRSICLPRAGEQRGNPVLWDRSFQTELMTVTGDTGGRALLDRYADRICEIEVSDSWSFTDIDTPNVYQRLIDEKL